MSGCSGLERETEEVRACGAPEQSWRTCEVGSCRNRQPRWRRGAPAFRLSSLLPSAPGLHITSPVPDSASHIPVHTYHSHVRRGAAQHRPHHPHPVRAPALASPRALIESHLLARTHSHVLSDQFSLGATATGDLTLLLTAIQTTSKFIATNVRKARLINL